MNYWDNMHVYTIVSTQIKPLESMELTQKEGVNIRFKTRFHPAKRHPDQAAREDLATRPTSPEPYFFGPEVQ